MKWRTLAVGSLVVAGACGLLWIGVRRHRFQYFVSGPDSQLGPQLTAGGYELRSLTTAEGVRLSLALRLPPTDDAPLLLLFPGNAERQLGPGLQLLEALRAGHAAGSAVVTYRGFEGSTGTPGPRAAAHDARALLEYLERELGVRGRRLVIAGFSMGSGIALRAAAELAQRGKEPAALVLLSPFWELELQPVGLLGPLLPSERYSVEEVIPYLRSRTIVVGAAQDKALPVADHARKLEAALGPRATYVELPDKDHADYLQDAASMRRIAALIWRGE